MRDFLVFCVVILLILGVSEIARTAYHLGRMATSMEYYVAKGKRHAIEIQYKSVEGRKI